jgi:hypothetical protein
VYTSHTLRPTFDKGWTNLRASGRLLSLDKPWTEEESA